MLTPNDTILKLICERLKSVFNPKKIYLFGSRSQDSHAPDSDYDLVIVVEKSDINMRERNITARMALVGVGAPVDIFVYTQSEFDEMKGEFNSVAELALNEGREVELG